MISSQGLWSKAVQNAAQMVLHEKTFIVRDLFPLVDWQQIPKEARRTLGSMFVRYVEENPGLYQKLGKTKKNQQIYIKL